MLIYSTRYPDRSEWRGEDGYRFDVRNDLFVSYADLRDDENRTRALFHAYERLARYDAVPVAVHQRMVIQKVKAMFYAAIDDVKQALDALDTGLFEAVKRADNGAVVDLLALRATIHQSVLRLRDAAEDIEYYLDILHEEGDEDAPADAAMALAGLIRLAGLRFYLAQYPTAEERLRDARNLIARVSADPIQAATIEWIQANLERWRGSPERALRHASAAANVFAESPHLGTAARVQALVADAALDFAQTFSAEGDREYQIRFALPHIQLARKFATEAVDEIGKGLIHLTLARYSRLCGWDEDRITSIEGVAGLARRERDDALLAQAFTALGDEMLARGERAQGMNLYRAVLEVLHSSDVPALEVWARRPLLRAAEFEV
ncbi:MAG TPA: hypothetical protein VKT52_06840 [Ktedonobacterales bacterium]|nr:hypothetical protein [Ktedonobacterales bacterium]